MRFLHLALVAALAPAPSSAQQRDLPEKPLAGMMPSIPDAAGPSHRPWGPLFISPMGEPFRGPDPQDIWFRQADADHDGRVSRAEFLRDAERWFAVLDRGHDGEIDPDDIDFYETVLVPEVRVGGAGGGGQYGGGRHGGGGGGRHGGGHGHGGGSFGDGGGGAGGGAGSGSGASRRGYGDARQGAARFGWFDYPEPITVMDTNLNRGIDAAEFRAAAEQRFAKLDTNGDGFIARGELPPLPHPGRRHGGGGGHGPGSDGATPVDPNDGARDD